jgi:hypothetical protein
MAGLGTQTVPHKSLPKKKNEELLVNSTNSNTTENELHSELEKNVIHERNKGKKKHSKEFKFS